MRLTELEPRFLRHAIEPAPDYLGRPMPDGTTQWGGFPSSVFHNEDKIENAHGIRFLCPKCFLANGGSKGTHSVHVYFTGSPVPDNLFKNREGKAVRWNVAGGSDFTNLTLTHSILLLSGCKWHGFITEGEATII